MLKRPTTSTAARFATYSLMTRKRLMYEPPEFNVPFLYGESYKNYLLPYERIESDAPPTAGIYGWFFRIRPQTDEAALQFLADLYQQRSLEADIRGTLRLHYTGVLRKTRADLSRVDSALLRQSLLAFPMPLYIGISKKLRVRLTTHKQQLEQCLLEPSNTSNRIEEAKTDTEEESRSFGQRLGTFWREHNFFGTDNLYIRYILASDTPSTSSAGANKEFRRLQEAETVLNSLINPVFGRR